MDFFKHSDVENDEDTDSSPASYPSQSTVIETRSGDKTTNNTRNR